MIMHIQSIHYEVWKIICDGPKVPTKTIDGMLVPKLESEWTSADYKDIEANAKSVNVYCALDAVEFNRICTYTMVKEIWDKLIVTHEGTIQVKESRVSLLVHNYELFKIKPDENISQIFTCITDIINNLKSLRKTYTNAKIVRKMLRSLPKNWETKVISVIEAMDISTLNLDELMGSLLTYELIMQEGEEQKDKNKKKGIAFKSTSKFQDEEEDALEEDEEMAFITKRFKRFMKKKQAHYKSECLELKKQFKKAKKKAMIATWGEDNDDNDSETDICKNKVANLCLMALEDENEVNDESFTFDELQTVFDELHAEFKKLRLKSNCQKKMILSLSQEKESLIFKINTLENKVLSMEKEKEVSTEKDLPSLKRK
ncbi:uncharacterized protein LOC114294300 [Camellia sinensis]|uniref:uncharacterized protein LOC114294300 n=1 Tax=Camellia sinensis TaxID=4442 RepID=UPI001035C161|nr:uncharacterized protein LOC114294300 [Camellia sinensis]